MKNLQFLFVITVASFVFHHSQAQNKADGYAVSFETFETKLKEASVNAQVLDARSPEEYKLNHLKGAINVSVADEQALQTQLKKLDKQKPVFVYSINNGRSGSLAKKLREQNFSAVYELPGGISKWIGAGRPVETTVGNGLTLSEYQKLLASEKLVLVDVHSKFCGSCKKLAPVVDSVARENSNTLKLVKIELFENKELGKELDIQSIPTLILYKGDKIVWRKSGITSKADIENVVKSNL